MDQEQRIANLEAGRPAVRGPASQGRRVVMPIAVAHQVNTLRSKAAPADLCQRSPGV
jgi:hypothetical protein